MVSLSARSREYGTFLQIHIQVKQLLMCIQLLPFIFNASRLAVLIKQLKISKYNSYKLGLLTIKDFFDD